MGKTEKVEKRGKGTKLKREVSDIWKEKFAEFARFQFLTVA